MKRRTMTKTNARKSAKNIRRPAKRTPTAKRPGRRPSARHRSSRTLMAGLVVVVVGVVAAVALNRADTGPSSPGRPFVGGDLHSLVMGPGTPSRLYVGGHEGVAVSDDGGRTFRQDNAGLPATDIHALGSGTGVIYAASPQLGIFASTDGGVSWEIRTDQVGQAFMGRILVDSRDPDRLVAPDMQGGAIQSSDGGRSWNVLGGVSGAMWVSWDAADTDRIVVSGMGQAALTLDGGRTWVQLEVPDGASVVEIDANDPDTLYAGVLEGTEAVVWISRDGGRTWTMP